MMFRALVTTLLMMLISLPHGVCFCHYLPAPAPAANFPEEDQPSPSPDSRPSHEDDDHDRDCPCCKLRPVLTNGVTPFVVHRDDDFTSLLMPEPIYLRAADALSPTQLRHFRHVDEPIPLILCALRI